MNESAEVVAQHGEMALYREAKADRWGNPIWGISYGDGTVSGPLLGGRLLAEHHWRLATDAEYGASVVAMFKEREREQVAVLPQAVPAVQLSLLEGDAA